MSLLEYVKTPADVKCLSPDELEVLAGEIRERIIGVVKKNGGHLSSNLGAVDIIVALYYVFDFPRDKIVFDVGHQAYAHKILSGRNDLFDTIRCAGGLSGFPNIFESEYDSFCAGHAGNSISASLGLCAARDAAGEDYNVIDFVGDASAFNGENLEAISSQVVKPSKFIIILNDNGMSISRNDNGLYKFFSRVTAKKSYGKIMYFAEKTIGRTIIGKALKRFKRFVKFNLNKTTTVIEAVGLKYYGLFDGNNVKELVRILRNLKDGEYAALLHLRTVKGKGMTVAENEADTYHGVSKGLKTGGNTFSGAVGDVLIDLAEEDKTVRAVCAGMKDGTGLKKFAEVHPDKFFDVGIAEEHAVTFAAGMALGGLKPFVCVYSTFLQRAYDQIMQDVCMQNANVTFLVDRAGAVGADGATHQGLFDLSYLGSLPGIAVYAPKDVEEFCDIVRHCSRFVGPCAVRYPNGVNTRFDSHTPIDDAPWEVFGDGGDNVVLAVGPRALSIAFAAAEMSDKKVVVVNARRVKPLDEGVLSTFRGKNVITVEENVVSGGFGSSVARYYAADEIHTRVRIFAFPDGFVAHATVEDQLESAGITREAVSESFV